MTRKPTIAVVIPAYNGGAYISETLDSVLAQTLPPQQVIVVNDGSTDNTREVLASYRGRIDCIDQENRGPSAARNRGFERAETDWVAFLDADDLWEPHKLERQRTLIADSDSLVCVHSGAYLFGRGPVVDACDPVFVDCEYTEELLIACHINMSTILVRRDVPTRFRDYRAGEDRIFCCELCREGGFGYVAEALAGYRQHTGATSASPGIHRTALESCLEWIDAQQQTLGPDRCDRIRRCLFDSQIKRMLLAKWQRAWPIYWAFREMLHEKWDLPEPLPQELSERIYPKTAYRAKDWLDGLMRSLRSPAST